MIRALARALVVVSARYRIRMLAVITLVMIPLASLGGVASASTVNAASQSPSADWWIWAAGLQQGQPTCGVTGQGPLFFVSELASPADCTGAHGQRVLAAVINFEWSKTEAQDPQLNSLFPPAICQDPAQAKLLACANWQAGHVTAKSATLDGRRLPVVRLTAPAFTETWADNKYFLVPAGPTPAAAAGYYVQLPPLTPGSHTLVVSGTVTNFPGLQSPSTLGATITLHQE